jgi:hypothetical protein
MNAALSIHGIRQKGGGANGIDLVVRGSDADFVDVDDLDYGYVLLKRVIFNGSFVERVAGGIKKWIDHEDVKRIFIFCHSNGLNFTFKALKKLRKRKQLGSKPIIVVAMSGCARRTLKTDDATEVHNWYTKHDKALKVAWWWPVPGMGSFGLSHYRGKSKNVRDKDISNHITGHSEWFDVSTLPTTQKKVNDLMRSYQ